MSLKAFHIFFIFACMVMFAAVGAWGVNDYQSSGDVANLAVGVVTLLLSVAMVSYLMWFIRKIKSAALR